MPVYTNINQLPTFKNSVITIGSFDGVHLGHRQILEQMCSYAKSIDGTAIVISFFPHPKKIVGHTTHSLQLLNTQQEKYQLLQQAGMEYIVETPFTTAFSQMPPAQYIEEFLVKNFKPHSIFIGYDHRFGRNREGDYHLLESMRTKWGYSVHEIPEHVLQNITISSTKIRQALLRGDVTTAKQYLGYPYFFSGKVVLGNQLGRTLGFPTANIEIADPDKLVPANGVYAATATLNNEPGLLKCMMNIGTRPTVDGSRSVIELHLFNFDRDIYDNILTVQLHEHLRPEVKFSGLDALTAQLQKDKDYCLQLIKNGML